MKVIILSAGQGKRLHPHTLDRPKCLVQVARGCSLLGWQLQQLGKAGFSEVVVVTGFGADQVEVEIQCYSGGMMVRSLFNPAYETTDNLASAALAAPEMTGDFVILNGDTLFTADLASGLRKAPVAPITVAVARKSRFDDDDMKAIIEGGRLTAVAKTLPAASANAESIGMIRFHSKGVVQFREALQSAIKEGNALGKYYLSAIDSLARSHRVVVHEVAQEDWAEVDVPADLVRARECVDRWYALDAADEARRMAG